MAHEHLWATWRSNYVLGEIEDRSTGAGSDPDGAGSLFERILSIDAPDSETYIVHRGPTCFVILNRFPYTSGHAMILPNRAVANLEDLTAVEHEELWGLVRRTTVVLQRALKCDGLNVGLNLGRVAGGSQSDHLHVHCVPRWLSDANFIAVAGATRVLSVSLDDAWRQVRAEWTEQE